MVPFDIRRNKGCSNRDRVFHRREHVVSKNIYPRKTKRIMTIGGEKEKRRKKKKRKLTIILKGHIVTVPGLHVWDFSRSSMNIYCSQILILTVYEMQSLLSMSQFQAPRPQETDSFSLKSTSPAQTISNLRKCFLNEHIKYVKHRCKSHFSQVCWKSISITVKICMLEKRLEFSPNWYPTHPWSLSLLTQLNESFQPVLGRTPSYSSGPSSSKVE